MTADATSTLGALLDRYRADEFSLLEERANEHGIRWRGRPAIERIETTTPDGRTISALRWGDAAPEIVLLHGGAQNAHTWDAVALELDRPLLCIDLPGHGRSAWRDDHDYRPRSMADDVAGAIAELAPRAAAVCGMSLGGMTSLALAQARPDLVRRLAVVDIAPGSDSRRDGPLFNFIGGPETFASLEEIVDRTVAFSPNRSRDALVAGILHNAVEQPDGTWRWRYDSVIGRPAHTGDVREAIADMWDAVDAIRVPTLLVRGAKSSAVSDEAVEEWKRRQPDVRVVVVDGAGHAVQSDKPLVLAGLLVDLLEA